MDGNMVTLAVNLVIWIALFSFIFKLDGKVKKLEEKMK